ncbi:MAG: glycine cleavage system protein GcvH [Phycisphaeraceae bacterium]|nr:glycine cleavage system protein GcvH [Phycisphaeraceae bacterium]MBX3366239.1 glycine cleavage system protein GcvH [Phycisphaeraceae bacterium]QYK48696.1 MAG: glycine cleavage system protein GcvH [Phycisphaeraceae bacterium]
MSTPSDRVYSESHEWFKTEGDVVTVGITRFAVDALTDVTYAQMKAQGTQVKPGDSLGEIESVKTTSDVYSLVGGTIEAVNGAVADDPSILNSDPYERGWLLKIRASDTSGLAKAMDAATYDAKHGH